MSGIQNEFFSGFNRGSVEITTLPKFLMTKKPYVDFVKINAEGSEGVVLSEIKQWDNFGIIACTIRTSMNPSSLELVMKTLLTGPNAKTILWEKIVWSIPVKYLNDKEFIMVNPNI